jgi:hypothetical protein
MLALNYGYWTFWENYGPQKVTFDGPNKLILVNRDILSLDFRTDVYSNWKEWLESPNHVNALYLQAMSVIGGDPLPGDRILGTTYFLENGWRMRTWEGDHSITLTGNVFTRDGSPIFVPTLRPWTIEVNLNTSTLVEGGRQVGAEIGIDTVLQVDEVHKIHGLNSAAALNVTPTTRTAGEDINQTIDDAGSGDVTVTRTD